MNTKQQVLKELARCNFKATTKDVEEIVWLVEMEDQSIEEAVNSIFESRYMDADDIDLDY